MGAVKADSMIRKYAETIRPLLVDTSSDSNQRGILSAMIDAHQKSEIGRRIDKIFEVQSWVVKPLHYIPVVGEIVGAAEDAKDALMAWINRETSSQEWYLLAARMADVAIKDYLQRKSNMIGQ